jgi:hypothetical protein
VNETETRLIEIVGEQREIPTGVEFLGQELFYVPWDMLELLDDDEFDWELECGEADQAAQSKIGNTHLTNPRRYDGKGLEQVSMYDLYMDLIKNGQVLPYLCRWVIKEDGTPKLQVLDGERRYRNTQRLRQQNIACYSRRDKKKLPALEVYDKIICKCVNADDEEALRLMYSVSDRHVAWGEGATAKLIWKMRVQFKKSDKEILDLTGKSEQWLREQDKICQLRMDGDRKTFQFLCEEKINRAFCLQMAKIKDVKERHYYLEKCYADAVEHQAEEVKDKDAAVARAEQKEELAEGQLAEAQEDGNTESIQHAEDHLDAARKKTADKRREREEANKPKAKTSNFRHVVEQEQEKSGGNEDVQSPLRPKKLEEFYLKPIQELYKNKGVLESTGKRIVEEDELFVLRYIEWILSSQLKGVKDVMGVLKRAKDAIKLERSRKK